MSLRSHLPHRDTDDGTHVACPVCLKPWLSARVAGRQICPNCGKEFDAVWFNPPAKQSIAASLSALDAASPCASHSGNAAEAVCGRCGRLMCGLCRVDTDNRILCTPCFERLAAAGDLPSAVTRITDHLIRARVYAIASIFLWFVFVLGPVALYMSIRALMERIRSGEREGRVSALVYVVTSLFGTALSVFLGWAIATGN